MKVLAKSLELALKIVLKVVTKQRTSPILWAHDGILQISGVTLDQSVRTTLPGEGSGSFGPIEVAAESMKSVAEFIKIKGTDYIDIDAMGVAAGGSRIEWETPQPPTNLEPYITGQFSDQYSYQWLKATVGHLASHAKDSFSWPLSGIALDRHGFAATDSNRLLFIPREHDLPAKSMIVIPAIPLKQALEMPGPFRPESVTLRASDHFAMLEWGTDAARVEFWIRLIDKEFPDYRRILTRRPKKKTSAHIVVDRELMALIKSQTTLKTERNTHLVTQIRLEKGSQMELITVRHYPYQRLVSTLPVSRVTGACKRPIQTTFLYDALASFPVGDKVRIEIHGGQEEKEEPVHLVSLSTGVRAVLMPVMVEDTYFAPLGIQEAVSV